MCCPFPFFLFVVVVGCLFVCMLFFCVFFWFLFIYLFLFCSSFIWLVLFRFLAWFSLAQCHFFVYLKVGGGQLESLCYFDHHTHFIICTVFIFIL